MKGIKAGRKGEDVFDPRVLLSFSVLLYLPFVNQVYESFALSAGEDLLQTPASPWKVSSWFNSQPLELKDLKGKVILVRWWTAPECPYCSASAPALNEFYELYHEKGLELIGLYHHKSYKPLQKEDVERYAHEFGFQFPIAIDDDWQTLRSWWLDKGNQEWTSVTFLLDRQGLIRHIHPGGQYVKGDEVYQELQRMIETLLKESPPSIVHSP